MSKSKTIVIKISAKKSGGGKGSRKIGRNKNKCARYRDARRRDVNKKRKIAKDLKLKAKAMAKKLRRKK